MGAGQLVDVNPVLWRRFCCQCCGSWVGFEMVRWEKLTDYLRFVPVAWVETSPQPASAVTCSAEYFEDCIQKEGWDMLGSGLHLKFSILLLIVLESWAFRAALQAAFGRSLSMTICRVSWLTGANGIRAP